MDKIVGKLILILFCLTSYVCASLELRLLNSQGKPISQVAAGEPFIIEAAITGLGQVSKQPDIAGLDAFDVQQSGVRMGNINGVWSARYSYHITIAKEGNYTIGPASIEHKGSVVTSNQLLVHVGTQTRFEDKKSDQESAAFARLLVAKKEVVVGQKVTCHLRFYYNDESVRPQQLLKQEHSTIPFKNIRGVNTGTQKLHGQTYAYVEWLWDMYPDAPGTIVIPAQAVDYTKSRQEEDVWAELSAIFGSRLRTERKRAYSNALRISVRELPSSDKKPLIVGALYSAEASVTPSVGKVGEGIVFAIELEGEGDFDGLESIPLTEIPEGLKYYDSKAVLLSKSNETPIKKRFEFVIQGLKEGEYEIPSQSLYYFDVKTSSYKTIHTQPVGLKIRSGGAIHNTPSNEKSKAPEECIIQESDNTSNAEQSGISAELWYPVKQSAIPWWLFVLIVLMPCLIGIRSFAMSLVHWSSIRVSQRLVFLRARKALGSAERQNDLASVYHIFNQVIAVRLKIPIQQVNFDLVEPKLTTLEQRASWKQFSMSLAAAVYAPGGHHDPQIFKEAYEWLALLETLL